MTRPPFAPELEAALNAMPAFKRQTITPERIAEVRGADVPDPPIPRVLADVGVVRRDVTIPGHHGGEIMVSVLTREGRSGTGPGVLQIHSGGMIIGDRFSDLPQWLPWVTDFDAVVVTVEYRLAPEHPDPYPVEDCYAALCWTAENVRDFGIDPERLIVAGASGGGGLAAGVALLARDRRGPALAGQLLLCPMLDDRDDTVAPAQFALGGIWDRGSNTTAWTSLLGDRRGTADVSIYAAPARAQDLAGLPTAFIDCGSAELFRDEDVAYASALWAAGVQAELHVWPGGFHGFDIVAPHTELAASAVRARRQWFARTLGIES